MEGWLEKNEFKDISRLLKLSGHGIIFSKKVSKALGKDFEELHRLAPFEKLMKFINILNTLACETDRELLAEPGFRNKISFEDSQRISVLNHFVKENYLKK